MPVARLPLQLAGLNHAQHLWWWRRTLRSRTVVSDWNDRHAAIFIHIPKTAGTSVLLALGIPPAFDTHAPARIYAAAYPGLYARAWRFAFVRNPWDRFASSFHFMQSGTDWPMQQRWAARTIGDLDFAAFTRRLREPLFKARVKAERFFWPQSFWLAGAKGSQGVQDIFRFEDLQQATHMICERLSIEPPVVTPHLRKSGRADFRTLYDGPMIDIVRDLYREDIDLLGYRFD